MDDQTDSSILLRLCWFLSREIRAEIAYNRAQYRVSYYRKLKAKIDKSKKSSEKWNDNIELSKKIEIERLMSLKKQEQLLRLKKKLRGPIAKLKKKLNATTWKLIDNNSIYLQTKIENNYKRYEQDAILRMADEYEANKVFNNLLKEDNDAAEV